MRALALVAALAGAARADASWDVRVPERVEIRAGETKPIEIAISVDRKYRVSRDAAVIVDLDAEAGLTVKKRRLGRADAADPDADAPRFTVPVRADAPTQHTVAIRVRFWLCAERTCRPVDAKRQVVVDVPYPAGTP